jgi:1,4-dihydroxy-2-naphthoate polyprenyltransferase
VAGESSMLPLIGLLAAPLALRPARTLAERRDGPALNEVLAETGVLLGIFSLLVTVGLLISA